MRKFFQILFLANSLNSFGQVAIINDPDGYTNVRAKGDATSEVIYKVYQNQVFWTDYVENYDENDWIPVLIPKNMYSLYDSEYEFVTGFIHRSRILQLDKLTELSQPNLKFKYTIQEFDKTKHHIELQDGRWVKFIDGRIVWGTDGNYPRTEVTDILAELNGKKIEIHKSLYSNLYECDNSFKIYQNGTAYFVHQWNSDAAGAYELVWVITENGLIQRLVGRVL